MSQLDTGEVNQYLIRIGLDPDEIHSADRNIKTLARLQTAHVRHVPFENLAIIGDPFEEGLGDGVTLSLDHLYQKIVEDGRGGYCFEINGLFSALLEALGFDTHRAAAMVLGEDGEASTPANHQTVIVSFDQDYIADPGLGKPQMEFPVPLDGKPTGEDAAGVAWRVCASDRPDCEYVVEVRTPEHNWEQHFVFDPRPRGLSYFEATSDYLSTAPESWWTSNVIVRKTTAHGYRQLFRDTFTCVDQAEQVEQEITETEWYKVLEREFGLAVPI